jgi:hypothetical protein
MASFAVVVDELSHAKTLLSTAAPTSRVQHPVDWVGPSASRPTAALLLSRHAAQAIFSGWLCACAVPLHASLGQPIALGSWLPRWVCLTREALHVWAPAQPAGGALRPLAAGLPAPPSDATGGGSGSGGKLGLQLVHSVGLGWGSGVWAEGVQDAEAAQLLGTHWHLWTPSGAWAFRTASEGEAVAWVLHVTSIVAGNRGVRPTSHTGSSAAATAAPASPPPLLLGQGDVSAAAEAALSASALDATRALSARLEKILGLWELGGRWAAELLSCFSVRQRLRALCSSSGGSSSSADKASTFSDVKRAVPPPQQQQQLLLLLRLWEFLRALENLSACSSEGAVLPVLKALAGCLCRRILLDSSSRATLVAVGVQDTLISCATTWEQQQQGAAQSSPAAALWSPFSPLMQALEACICSGFLVPFSHRLLQPCTGYTIASLARASRVGSALQSRFSFSSAPQAAPAKSPAVAPTPSFFSTRLLLGSGSSSQLGGGGTFAAVTSEPVGSKAGGPLPGGAGSASLGRHGTGGNGGASSRDLRSKSVSPSPKSSSSSSSLQSSGMVSRRSFFSPFLSKGDSTATEAQAQQQAPPSRGASEDPPMKRRSASFFQRSMSVGASLRSMFAPTSQAEAVASAASLEAALARISASLAESSQGDAGEVDSHLLSLDGRRGAAGDSIAESSRSNSLAMRESLGSFSSITSTSFSLDEGGGSSERFGAWEDLGAVGTNPSLSLIPQVSVFKSAPHVAGGGSIGGALLPPPPMEILLTHLASSSHAWLQKWDKACTGVGAGLLRERSKLGILQRFGAVISPVQLVRCMNEVSPTRLTLEDISFLVAKEEGLRLTEGLGEGASELATLACVFCSGAVQPIAGGGAEGGLPSGMAERAKSFCISLAHSPVKELDEEDAEDQSARFSPRFKSPRGGVAEEVEVREDFYVLSAPKALRSMDVQDAFVSALLLTWEMRLAGCAAGSPAQAPALAPQVPATAAAPAAAAGLTDTQFASVFGFKRPALSPSALAAAGSAALEESLEGWRKCLSASDLSLTLDHPALSVLANLPLQQPSSTTAKGGKQASKEHQRLAPRRFSGAGTAVSVSGLFAMPPEMFTRQLWSFAGQGGEADATPQDGSTEACGLLRLPSKHLPPYSLHLASQHSPPKQQQHGMPPRGNGTDGSHSLPSYSPPSGERLVSLPPPPSGAGDSSASAAAAAAAAGAQAASTYLPILSYGYRFPLPLKSRTLCWAQWCPAMPPSTAPHHRPGSGLDSVQSSTPFPEGLSHFPTHSFLTLACIARVGGGGSGGGEGGLQGSLPAPLSAVADYSLGVRALERMLLSPWGSRGAALPSPAWKPVIVGVHVDGSVSVEGCRESIPEEGPGGEDRGTWRRVQYAEAGLASAWSLLARHPPVTAGLPVPPPLAPSTTLPSLLLHPNCPPPPYALFHAACAMDICASRCPAAPYASIDITFAGLPDCPAGVFTLVPCGELTAAHAPPLASSARAWGGVFAPATALPPGAAAAAPQQGGRGGAPPPSSKPSSFASGTAGALSSKDLLESLWESSDCPIGRANTYAATLSAGYRMQVSITLSQGSSPAAPAAPTSASGSALSAGASAAVLSGSLWKRGAINSAFKLRQVRLMYRPPAVTERVLKERAAKAAAAAMGRSDSGLEKRSGLAPSWGPTFSLICAAHRLPKAFREEVFSAAAAAAAPGAGFAAALGNGSAVGVGAIKEWRSPSGGEGVSKGGSPGSGAPSPQVPPSPPFPSSFSSLASPATPSSQVALGSGKEWRATAAGSVAALLSRATAQSTSAFLCTPLLAVRAVGSTARAAAAAAAAATADSLRGSELRLEYLKDGTVRGGICIWSTGKTKFTELLLDPPAALPRASFNEGWGGPWSGGEVDGTWMWAQPFPKEGAPLVPTALGAAAATAAAAASSAGAKPPTSSTPSRLGWLFRLSSQSPPEGATPASTRDAPPPPSSAAAAAAAPPLSPPAAAPPLNPQAYCLTLVSPERIWHFAFDTSATAGAWLAVLAASGPSRDATLLRALPPVAMGAGVEGGASGSSAKSAGASYANNKKKPFPTADGTPEVELALSIAYSY